MKLKQSVVSLALAGLCVGTLVGCADSGREEVQAWMNTEAKKLKGKVDKIDEPKKFSPFKYEAEREVDPFNSAKVTALAPDKAGKGDARAGLGIKPDFDRPKQVLEAFPTENLKLVGVLQQKGSTFGLIAADKNLYRVRVGEYMGQNFGLITKINESEITLKEIVQDPTGEYQERVSTLQLQEARK